MSREAVIERINIILDKWLEAFSAEDKRSISVYEKIYEECPGDKVKKGFAIWHKKTNALFEFMNRRSGKSRYFNADPSRELLEIIEDVDSLEEYYGKLECNLIIDKKYKKHFSYVKTFLQETNGSTIPLNYERIKIEDLDPVFTFQLPDENFRVKMEDPQKIGRESTKEKLEKIEERINEEDYSGAITICRSFLEEIYEHAYKEISGKKFVSKGNLMQDWKKVALLLKSNPENRPDESLQQILRGLTTINSGLAEMRNKMSDSHRESIKPERRDAIFARNTALTIADFLLETIDRLREKGIIKPPKNNA